MIHRLLGIVLCIALAACGVKETRTQSVASSDAQKFAAEFAAALREGDQKRVVEIAAREAALPAFNTYPERTQLEVYQLLGRHYREARNNEASLREYEKATALPSATLDDWRGRLIATDRLGRDRDVALVLIEIAKRWPWSITTMDARGSVSNSLYRTRRLGDDAIEFDLMRALYDAQWRSYGHHLPGFMHRRYALMLIARGDLARAKQVVAGIDTYRDAIIVQIDRRFQPARERFWKTPLAEIVAADVARAESRASAENRSLEALHDLFALLLIRGDHDRVIALASDAIASATADPAAFEDTANQLPWTIDYLAHALFRANRIGEGVAQLEAANRRSDQAVSHAINLAEAYCRTGRPADALRTLPTAPKDASEFGNFLILGVKLCVAIETRDRQSATALLSQLRERRKDAPVQHLNMLADLERRDEFIGWLSEALQDEQTRSDVLFGLQNFRETAYSDFQRRRHARIKEYLGDPAAMKAIDAVGLREEFELFEELD